MNNIIGIPIRPFPAVRVNSKGWRFTPRAKEYHNKMNELRSLINKDIDTIIKALNQGCYELIFYFAIPKTKRKIKFCEMPYDIRPDTDNLFKSFTDSIFYWKDTDDKWIWKINAVKRYWDCDKIMFCYQD